MSKIAKGFTLVELIIVIAIIAILTAIAIPFYGDYVVRSKMSGVIANMSSLKAEVASAFTTSGMNGVLKAHIALNSLPAEDRQSYYVLDLYINPTNGTIAVTTTDIPGRLPPDAMIKSLTLTPNINGQPLADGLSGTIEWGCSSQTHNYATAKGIQIINIGTLAPKYVPPSCQ